MKNKHVVLLWGSLVVGSLVAWPIRQTLSAKEEPTVHPLKARMETPEYLMDGFVHSTTLREEPSGSTVEETGDVSNTHDGASNEPEVSTTVSASKEESGQGTEPTNEGSISNTVPPSTEPSVEGETSETTESSDASSKDSEKGTTVPSIAPEAARVIQSPTTTKEVEKNFRFSVARIQTTQEFIHTIGDDAQKIAWGEELYASVMIAQAILETGSGNSQLARPPHHNLFGIKGSYKGKQVNFSTQEDDGSGNLYTIQSGFRQYPSYTESLEDYAQLLKQGISGNSGYYQNVWKSQTTSYEEATKALTGRYATDTQYNAKLNALIEAYGLTEYDQAPSKEKKERSVEAAEKETEAAENKPAEATNSSESQTILERENVQGVTKLLPIPQRPAKQVSGQMTTH